MTSENVLTYQAARVALLTQHGKESVIGAVLEPALGCQVERVEGFDTDHLGTFTRDIPRAGTQLEAARRKARLGMELSGLPLGMASEGSFGPDPFMGMLPWNPECGVPGFSVAEREEGLLCEDCGTPTREAMADIYQCCRCRCRLRVERQGGYAPAGCCDNCNP